MDAAEDGPRRPTTAMRVVLAVFLVLAGLAFVLLHLRGGHTAREFAWTIKPEITAAFLGAGYGAGCVLVAASLRRLALSGRVRGCAHGRHLAVRARAAPGRPQPPGGLAPARLVQGGDRRPGCGELAGSHRSRQPGGAGRGRPPPGAGARPDLGGVRLPQLGAVARYSHQVQWHEVGAWIWLALLLNAIVTGGYQLLAAAGGTAEGQPATIG